MCLFCGRFGIFQDHHREVTSNSHRLLLTQATQRHRTRCRRGTQSLAVCHRKIEVDYCPVVRAVSFAMNFYAFWGAMKGIKNKEFFEAPKAHKKLLKTSRRKTPRAPQGAIPPQTCCGTWTDFWSLGASTSCAAVWPVRATVDSRLR